ncbi:restriction endonuclease subunit S [Cytobacillus suaedae]|nr:restriction endonuclease subunit S [Cytobacillus suaedae]
MNRLMKDSGTEWIGQIPSEWEITKLKNTVLYIDSGGTPTSSNEEFYNDVGTPFVNISDMSSYEYVNNTKKHLSEEGLKSKNLKTHTEGTILYSIYASIGKVSELNIPATISQAMLALAVNEEKVLKSFFKYNLKHAENYVSLLSSGTTQDNLSREKVENLKILLPEIEEQRKIAKFLDEKVSQIDLIIGNTKQSIEEFRKYKESLITETVTKGLNLGVKMKESGFEWIGEIPEHWQTIKIKYILFESNEKSISGLEEPLSMSQKYGLIPTKNMDLVPNMATSYIGNKLVRVNDLVFNKLKAHLGVFAVSEYDGIVSPDYAVYYSNANSKVNVNVKFLEYLFKTPLYINEFKRYSKGVAAGLTRLYTKEFFNIKCALPSIEEQNKIINYIKEKTEHIENLIEQKGQLIEEMESYKKSLIHEYVTGKKEVL